MSGGRGASSAPREFVAQPSVADPGLASRTRFDQVIEVLLVGLTLFAPAAFASVEPWSEQVVLATAALVALCFALKLLVHPEVPFVWSWTYLPIGMFLLLILFQLLPLPPQVLRYVSPNTLALKTHLLADISQGPPGSTTLSFYAWATQHDLRLLLAVVAIYIVSLNVFRTSHRIKRLLAGISITAGLVALLALAQDVSGTEDIYWLVHDLYIRKATAGPFVHYNMYCEYMSMAVGAGIGLLLVLIEERRHEPRHELGGGGMLEGSAVPLWCIAAFVILGISSIYLSRSRGGAIALTAALSVGLIPIGKRWGSGRAGWSAVALLVLVFAIILAAGFESVTSRLVTLRHPVAVSGGRLQMVKDILLAWRKFPILGTGLGTHQWVYPLFISFPSTYTYTHAENEYVQMLEETGLIGLSLVICFLGMIWATVFRLLRRQERPLHAAVYGLAIGLLAVNIQSFADFGQHLLADAVLTSIVLAIIVSLGKTRHRRRDRSGPSPLLAPAPTGVPIGLRWAALIVVVLVSGWGLLAADRSRRSTVAYRESRFLAKPVIANGWVAPDATYARIINAAWTAARIDPSNVEYCYWLGLYQWNAVLCRHDPKLPDDAFSESDRKTLKQIVAEFNRLRGLCPTYGLPAALAGQIAFFVLDDPAGARAVQIAYETAANNPWVGEIAASTYVKMGDLPRAMEVGRHYLTLNGEPPPPIIPANISQIFIEEAKRPDLAVQLADNNPDRLAEIVALLRAQTDRPEFQNLAAELDVKSNGLRRARLEAACKSGTASAEDLAAMGQYSLDANNLNKSVEYYQRALVLNYDRVDWRLKLAEALLKQGRSEDAVHEAGICLRLQPDMPAAREFIANASGRSNHAAGL